MIQPTSGITYADYWGAIKNGNFTHIRMTFTGQNIVLTDEDIELIGGITIQDLVNSDADLHIGKAVCRQFTAHIFNSNKLNGINWFGEFQFEMGVEINGTTQWVTVGYFKGEKPKKVVTVDVIEFTAYDRMKLFDAPAKDFIDSYIATMDSGGIGYVSMETLFHDMCTYLGIGYNNGDANDNINTAEYRSYIKKVSGCTYREILGYMAETCGCYARIDNVGNAKFIWFTDYNHAITANEEYNVEFDEIQVPSITCIKIQPYNKETFMKYPENGAETSIYYIKQNPIIVATEYQPIVFNRHMKRIFDMLTGIGTYTPTTIECIGCWLVEAGDIITASVDGQDVSIPIFNKTMHWAGSIVDQYELTGDMQRSVDYDMNDPVQQTALQILDRIASPATRNDLLDEVLDTGFYYFSSANIGGESTDGVIYSANGSNTSYQLAMTSSGRLLFRRVTSNYIGTWKEFVNFEQIKNDLTATDEGFVLDARQGKVLNDKISLQTPTTPTWDTTKVNTAAAGTYMSIRRCGHVVRVGGGFVANASIGLSDVLIASGFPKSIDRIIGSIVAMNTSTNKPLSLAINSSGELRTYYSGEAIASGQGVRFNVTYFTNDQ